MSNPLQLRDSHLRRRRLLLGLAFLILIFGGIAALQPPGSVSDWLLRSGVVSIKDAPLRKEYEDKVTHLCDQVPSLRTGGLSAQEIARLLHGERRALGLRYKNLTPEPLRAQILEVNRRRYGDPLGPTFDYLEKKNSQGGSVNYEAIIAGACRPNANVNNLIR